MHVVVRVEDGNVGASLIIEVEGSHLAEHAYRLFYCSHQHVGNILLVFKFYLGLCGMNVYVDVFGGHVKINKVGHLFAFRHQAVVGVHHHFMKIGMLHVASVYEEELSQTLFLCAFGFAYKASDVAYRHLCVDGYEHGVDAFAQHVDDALAQASRLQVIQFGFVAV